MDRKAIPRPPTIPHEAENRGNGGDHAHRCTVVEHRLRNANRRASAEEHPQESPELAVQPRVRRAAHLNGRGQRDAGRPVSARAPHLAITCSGNNITAGFIY